MRRDIDPDRTTVNQAIALDPDRTTVNQAIALDPERVGPLSRLGIDTCCGGSLTLRVAAERHGVDLDVLLEAIGVPLTHPGRAGPPRPPRRCPGGR